MLLLTSSLDPQHFAELFPQLRTQHLFPGYVATNAASTNFHPIVGFLQGFINPIATRTFGNTAKAYADIPVFAASNPQARTFPGIEWLSPRMTGYGRPKWVDEEKEKRVAVWEQLKGLMGEK